MYVSISCIISGLYRTETVFFLESPVMYSDRFVDLKWLREI